jgi:N-acetylglutamate synthase-like GNAT family acetyltransferase
LKYIDTRLEKNETGFCSLWADRIRIHDCADLFVNDKLSGDYFFNRLNPFTCYDTTVVIEEAVRVCKRRGTDCYVHIHDKKSSDESSLLQAGFELIDTMQILKAESDKFEHENDKIKVVRADLASIHNWVDTFCKSFDVLEWKPEVSKIIHLHFDKLILLLALIHVSTHPQVGGCAALYASHGVMGVYCLGTISDFRGLGLAKTMVGSSLEIARQQGINPLFLQTFTNDGLRRFYKKLGFHNVYKKKIYASKRNSQEVEFHGASCLKLR